MAKKVIPIKIVGANENNLKGINLDLNPGELIVFTGLSGAGKSTLLFDVLHAEGQRKYVETFSPYIRQFLETLPKPKVDSVKNIRPSIAVEQKNTIKNSRSTVGTMTELCDYFKVWFSQVASFHDPQTGNIILNQTCKSLTEKVLKLKEETLVFGFIAKKPKTLSSEDFISFLLQAGHSRVLHKKKFISLENIKSQNFKNSEIFIAVDRVSPKAHNKSRIYETISSCIQQGNGKGEIRNQNGKTLLNLYEGLRSPKTGHEYKEATPSAFSFNSPIGACPNCKGFGSVIRINPNLVIPDTSLSIEKGAIKPFNGKVYGHCLNDLLRECRKKSIPTTKAWSSLSKSDQDFVWNGEGHYSDESSNWYGINSFFDWAEKKTYKMHVRVFLSKYRGYFICPDCNGDRLKKESVCWKWNSLSLPELYDLSIDDLLGKLEAVKLLDIPKIDIAVQNIKARLKYLQDVGLGYLSLNRSAKTLSGGETQRVNLTACLGASLTETLFALDEPTIGLHGRDIKKLITVLRALADAGNCVCVVEHDEEIIKSADKIFEIGPRPGVNGGRITFTGSVAQIKKAKKSITGKWLSRCQIKDFFKNTKSISKKSKLQLKIKSASKHNINNLSCSFPIEGLTCIAGISGSGKSTLAYNIIYNGLRNQIDDLGNSVISEKEFEDIVLIDQSSVVRSPRSNPVLYTDAWNPIKEAFSRLDAAKKLGFSSSDFSFNSGYGRCETCSGLGYEIVEMQFLSDIQVPCKTCNGKRFKEELLSVKLDGLNITEILNLNIEDALGRFEHFPGTFRKLNLLKSVGLGYLQLGQPLNTLSGGESQRLKLIKFMSALKLKSKPSLLIIDEPTTGLHLEDVDQLMKTLNKIAENGHSLLVIEHHKHVLAQADWICEMGPGAGKLGGKIISSCTPSQLIKLNTPTADILKSKSISKSGPIKREVSQIRDQGNLTISGARENNLKNIFTKIPKDRFVVVTGPSGSGKSSLAFQVVFAEGQRRFMESMSSYARQFIQQVGRPDVDEITGISPTVAIEQRVTRGSKKSTVGSITEIAQYLRLLYAKLGTQLSLIDGKALTNSNKSKILNDLVEDMKIRKPTKKYPFILLSPLVTNRKGHHKPIINWALQKGFEYVRCNENIIKATSFEGLDRYKIHNIELVIESFTSVPDRIVLKDKIDTALKIGNERLLTLYPKDDHQKWFSIDRVDPTSGESYPKLEPSLLSWNSARGWCQMCKGYGRIYEWMKDELPASGKWWQIEDGEICSECQGERLNPIARKVVLITNNNEPFSLPEILKLTPSEIFNFLKCLKSNSITKAIIPEVVQRLKFMERVGLNYLSLDRESSSLSGGEAQRIRLASQLGSNLSGVLYVLDEPSIGLHPKDNQKLIMSLRELQKRGNSLLVVEHDPETINQADYLIDVGPAAGLEGGKIIGVGKPKDVISNKTSKTSKYLREGMKHPLKGSWRNLPNKKKDWIEIADVNFRNLKNINLSIPIESLSVCCGVSGSGKSSLIRGFLKKAVHQSITQKSKKTKLEIGSVSNADCFSKIVEVTQAPIGKTSRSTPATYLGVWDRIRTLISSLPEAKARGFTPSDFSFNVKGGRCEKCKGAGRIKVEMSFLPNSFVECADCNGKRYNEEILKLYWNTKNIADILEMNFEEACEFFKFEHVLYSTFCIMVEAGLGYIKLGQTSPTLSGGEAQRLKLASELSKSIDKSKYKNLKKVKPSLFILEEPTIGLHTSDCRKLILLLQKLVDNSNTVIVIEHDMDLVAEADYIIELGPEGGEKGGQVIFSGATKDIVKSKSSPTAPFLTKILSN